LAPPRVNSLQIMLRLQKVGARDLDAWIAAQPEPQPSRQDVIKLALRWFLEAHPAKKRAAKAGSRFE
jgi:hypothetical protein